MTKPIEDQERQTSRGKVIDGARWIAVSEVLRQILRVGVSLFLARWLGREEYGLAAIAILVNLFLQTARDLGTGEAIVQAKEIDEGSLSSLFWFNTAVGAFLFSVVFLSAPLIADVFNEPDATDLVRMASLAIVIAGLGIVPRAVLRRNLRFRSLARISIFSALVNAVVALTLAANGAGAWSIAYATVATAAATTAAYVFACSWRPRVSFRFADIVAVSSFSLNLSAYRLLNFFTAHGDKVIVGAVYTKADLGGYNLANRLVKNPMTVAQVSFGTVLFPAMSKFQDDNPRICAAYLRGIGIVAAVMFPIVALITALARPLVAFALGDDWLSAVPLIGIIAVVGAIQSMTMTTGTLFRVKNRTDLMFRFGLVAAPVTLSAYWLGAKVSVEGVAWGYLAAMTLLFYPVFWLALGLIDMPVRRLMARITPVALAATATGLFAYGLRRLLEAAEVGDFLILIVAGPAAIIFFLVLAGLGRLRPIVDLFSEVIPQRFVVGPLRLLTRRRRPSAPSEVS